MAVQATKNAIIRASLNNESTILKRSGQHAIFDFRHVRYLVASLTKKAQLDPRLIDPWCDEILQTFNIREPTKKTTAELKQIILNVTNAYPEIAHLIHTYDHNFEQTLQEQQNLDQLVYRLHQKDQTIANENANKDSNIFNTQRDLTAGLVGKTTGLKLLPKVVAKAHLKGDLHYHDLDYHPYAPMTNCCLIDFKEMLSHGFKIGNAEVESPHSIQTATAQISQIIANVASSQYGGCSVDRIDELLAPFAKKNYDKNLELAKEWVAEANRTQFAKERTKKEIYDAMQSLEYEINTLFTSNGQTPFTSVGFGLGRNWFEREIQKAILTIRIEGLGIEKRTAIFPKLIFTIKKGINFSPTDPNYDIKQLALTCSTRRMYPDILNYDKIVELTGSFKVPMGCRSFLQSFKDQNGKEITSGRMNLGVVTLNLPRLALRSQQDQAYFWQLFEDKLELAKEALCYRIKRCKEAVPKNAPILFQSGAFGIRLSDTQTVDEVFKNKRATISLGYIGLYEVATVFYGPDWEQNPKAKQFTLDIVKKMDQATSLWSEEYGYHFSVYATPSESLTDRFCRLDQERFGLVPSITDKAYYTNSFHYDVRKQPTPFEKLDFEKDYPVYSSGGFIHYCEYPILKHNPKALEAVWDYAYSRVGYLGTNTPIDRCFECGFEGEFTPTERGFECPTCHNHDPKKCEVVKRTCGYLGNPQARPMVHGRHKEITARKKHL